MFFMKAELEVTRQKIITEIRTTFIKNISDWYSTNLWVVFVNHAFLKWKNTPKYIMSAAKRVRKMTPTSQNNCTDSLDFKVGRMKTAQEK